MWQNTATHTCGQEAYNVLHYLRVQHVRTRPPSKLHYSPSNNAQIDCGWHYGLSTRDMHYHEET